MMRLSNAPAQPTHRMYSGRGCPRSSGRRGPSPSPCAGRRRCPTDCSGARCCERALQLRRRLLLLEHQVLAHLQDLQRVLDEHRADFLARAARRARPQRVLGDAAADERHVLAGSFARGRCPCWNRSMSASSGPRVGQRRPHIVADVVNDLHRRQVLARVVRGAVVRAARALGARVPVEQPLPRELSIPGPTPVADVSSSRFSFGSTPALARLRT